MERITIICKNCGKTYYIEDPTTIQGLKLRAQIYPLEKQEVRCPYCSNVNTISID